MHNISVIIPTYNREETLRRAIDSVLNQSRQAAELIVVDDGSTDSTSAILASYSSDLISIKQDNKGVSAARNAGVEKASSEWLAFLDSDDEWMPQKLERQYLKWSEFPDYKIVHCDELWIRNGLRVNKPDKFKSVEGNIFRSCLSHCAISPSSVVLEKALLDELNAFDESFPVCEDYDLWLRLCCCHPVLLCSDALLKKYGGHSDQLSHSVWGIDRYRVLALNKLLSNPDLSSLLDEEQKEMVMAALFEKCNILKAGAEKRANREVLDFIEKILSKHQGISYAQ